MWASFIGQLAIVFYQRLVFTAQDKPVRSALGLTISFKALLSVHVGVIPTPITH